VVRILFVVAYIAGAGTLRSIVWGVALAINIAMLFVGA
jgi:uncharacterized MAPEG superfamily protein